MSMPPPTERGDQTFNGVLRRRFIVLASILAVLAFLHFVDHAIRGELVVRGGLDPTWNHSGWPFNCHSDKPYIFPLAFVIVFGLVLGGIFGTLRGWLWAGYWLPTSTFLAAFLAVVHFVGFSPGSAETPYVIVMSYRHTIGRVLAMVDLFGMFAVLATLAFQSVRIRQRSGRW
jgi:hypothetical protein